MSRLMWNSNGHLLADVDPWLEYPNIIEYTHPLDPWGVPRRPGFETARPGDDASAA